MSASNYWARLFGANILASVFGPDVDPLWLDTVLHLFVVLGIMLATSPAKQERS